MDDERLKIIHETVDTLTDSELNAIKEMARMYNAGKAFAYFAVGLCTVGASVLGFWHLYKGD